MIRTRTSLCLLAGLAVLVPVAASASAPPTDDGESTTRRVEHSLGTVDVPTDPQRIVVMDSSYLLDNLIAFGYGDAIVGRADFGANADVRPTWLEDDIDLDTVEFVGSYGAYNLERIAGLQPDLIVGAEGAVVDVYDDLSAVAPVLVVTPGDNPLELGPWQGVTRATGAALGDSERAEQLVADGEAVLDAALADAPDGWADRSVSVILGAQGFGVTALAGEGSEATQWYEYFGWEINPGFPGAPYTELSDEVLGELEADVLAVVDYDLGTVDWGEYVADHPVMATLEVVQRGDVAVLTDGYLVSMAGPLGVPDVVALLFAATPAP